MRKEDRQAESATEDEQRKRPEWLALL